MAQSDARILAHTHTGDHDEDGADTRGIHSVNITHQLVLSTNDVDHVFVVAYEEKRCFSLPFAERKSFAICFYAFSPIIGRPYVSIFNLPH